MNEAFWQHLSPEQMSREQWESLCDGCARCCMIKLEDEDSGELHYTNVVCRYLDQEACQCTCYGERTRLVPTCVVLNPENVEELSWMPSSCAYRLLAQGDDLPQWHPLVSGDQDSVHIAGVSVRGKVYSETDVDEEDLPDHVIDWAD